jgi:tricorn protease
MKKIIRIAINIFALILIFTLNTKAQETRLLRQPDIYGESVVFAYGGDLWLSQIGKKSSLRLTSTPSVESHPHFSPDGKWISFTSNRSGVESVYIVSAAGGDAKRVTWHPSSALVRGWTKDGSKIIYASGRESAPSNYNRLWTVPVQGGPSKMLSHQWAFDGDFNDSEDRIAIDKMTRWDVEWRAYRGGQNTPLILLDLKTQKEELIPNEKNTDIQPIWIGDFVYYISDKDFTSNLWSYNTKTKESTQLTKFDDVDIKSLSGRGNELIFEQDGYLHKYDIKSKSHIKLEIHVVGDFPWANTKWEDVSKNATSASLSPNGKRMIASARGDVFTAPIEFGSSRNITSSSNAADRAPLWSPLGDKVAWFSDASQKGYQLMIANQDGLSKPEAISLGESKMAWNPAWSPDGKYIVFVDNQVRLQLLDLATKAISTIDIGTINIERDDIIMSWSHDSQWIAYQKAGSNNLRQIFVYSLRDKKTTPITDSFADSFSPSWDLNGRHLYFLASTDVALGSGWANTSAITSDPKYAAYVVNLRKKDDSPFKVKSDEEAVKKEDAKPAPKPTVSDSTKTKTVDSSKMVLVDFDGISRRILPLGMPIRNYSTTVQGPEGSVFVLESIEFKPGSTVHKFTLKDKKTVEFASGVLSMSITPNGKHVLARTGEGWKMLNSEVVGDKGKSINLNFQMKLDKQAEWKQMFEETWRYEKDYFYDPNIHGRDWSKVYKKYAPLVPFIKHRSDLNFILDQINGELSVGHSFVGGGDFPEVDKVQTGMLGADFEIVNSRYRIKRIYTSENWNPDLSGPLDQPGFKIKEGDFIVGVNGVELDSTKDIYELLDGTLGKQTLLHIHNQPQFEGHWTEIVEPTRSENSLRQRTWVEDNKRMVDKLSGGRLGYIWVPNTGGPGFVSFNRYYFAQQDKEGAVVDERFNGGGLLDDYMVDLMTRKLRAALTNEVPNGKSFKLPAGILGPKALLINELAGSGGDFFPWVFRQQKAGPLIGATTWGGLVKSTVHYSLVDGGFVTAPDNAVFDPNTNQWIAENKGVSPDIEVRQDAASLSQGKDPQLERAVQELLKALGNTPKQEITHPPFSKPAIKP